MAYNIWRLQRKGEVFVSFREMITSQLQGKLWLYDEVAAAKAAQLDLEIPKEVVQADPAPAQAPQAPPAAPAPRNIPQRLQRLEEEVRGLCESFREQRLVVDTLSRDFSRFTTWAVGRLGRLLDASSVMDIDKKTKTKPRAL
ncbi:hypothetical protein Tco_0956346 [Tanacetum coccineum]